MTLDRHGALDIKCHNSVTKVRQKGLMFIMCRTMAQTVCSSLVQHLVAMDDNLWFEVYLLSLNYQLLWDDRECNNNQMTSSEYCNVSSFCLITSLQINCLDQCRCMWNMCAAGWWRCHWRTIKSEFCYNLYNLQFWNDYTSNFSTVWWSKQNDLCFWERSTYRFFAVDVVRHLQWHKQKWTNNCFM